MSDFNTIYGGNPAGSNDGAMREPSNGVSDTVNSGVNWLTDLFGYDSHRVTESGGTDNPFYRNNAQYMPGWGNTFGLDFLDPHGVPSGATAQDRATNYVGHDDDSGIWADVRRRLVENEGAAIEGLPRDAAGRPEGNISFTDVYGAHVSAYHDAQESARDEGRSPDASNPFIDPLSFGLAMYAAPLLEQFGINAGPVTGASIDFFNDPTDSVGEGWLKRAGLGVGEMAIGGMVAGPLGMLPGAASLAWNTGTALDAYSEREHLFGTDEEGHGIGLGQWAGNAGDSAGAAVSDFTGSETLGTIADGVTTGAAAVGGGLYTLGAGAVDLAGDAWDSITSLF